MRQVFQHHLNAMHIMARLVRFGLPRPAALVIAQWWEQCMHPLLYGALWKCTQVRVASPVRIAMRPRRPY
jgi:hypothetical protein